MSFLILELHWFLNLDKDFIFVLSATFLPIKKTSNRLSEYIRMLLSFSVLFFAKLLVLLVTNQLWKGKLEIKYKIYRIV